MKKNLFVLFFVLAIELVGISRDLGIRRMNESVLEAQHIYNSTEKIIILKSLSLYDKEQIKLNAGRLFIRGTIIME